MTKNKYNASKTVVDGITFDSRKEAERYNVLMQMQEEGKIKDLQLQVKFELIPPQKFEHQKSERAVNYIADFVYYSNTEGMIIVEDVKGKETKDYIIKRKLMKYQHPFYIFRQV